MNILVPTADYPPIEGGIATVTLELSRELAALGHNVTVVAPYFPGMANVDAAEPVTVHRFRGYRLGWLRFVPLFFACLPHLRRCDLLLGINIAYGGVIGLLAKKLLRRPYITFGYAYEFLKFRRGSLPARLLLAAYTASDLVVAISRFTRDNLIELGVAPDRIATLFPGSRSAPEVDAQRIRDLRDGLVLNGHRVVLSVGRIISRKGHDRLVRALPAILEAHPDTVLVCAGRGPALPGITRIARDLGVRDRVRFPGKLDDAKLEALYAACDVFALPAGDADGGQVEGFGLVFTEAAAHGKPSVAGRSGGIPDAVRDGETGLLVEPGDVDELARAINRLLSDADLARNLGHEAKRRVERELNWRVFTRNLLDAWEARR